MSTEKSILHHCLYFTANSLARIISKMAEEEFRFTGLSPSHAFLMMVVIAEQGIGPKVLGKQLHLAPSTITRFIDGLVHRGYLVRKTKGKTVKIYATQKGKELQTPIEKAWKRLYQRYSDILGIDAGNNLTRMIDEAGQMLLDEK